MSHCCGQGAARKVAAKSVIAIRDVWGVIAARRSHTAGQSVGKEKTIPR